MHALYLGVAKTALKEIIPEDAYLKVKTMMRQSIDFNPQAPGDPMSKKITKKKFSYIKAVEFKNFMTSMAPAVLRPPTLSVSEYDHLMELVVALRILDSGMIKITDIDVVHNLLLNFAKKYEQEIGRAHV